MRPLEKYRREFTDETQTKRASQMANVMQDIQCNTNKTEFVEKQKI